VALLHVPVNLKVILVWVNLASPSSAAPALVNLALAWVNLVIKAALVLVIKALNSPVKLQFNPTSQMKVKTSHHNPCPAVLSPTLTVSSHPLADQNMVRISWA